MSEVNLTTHAVPNGIRDLTGRRFGRLVVVGYVKRLKWGGNCWLCECDCGNQTLVTRACLVNGHVKSCKCLPRDRARAVFTTHGMSYSDEYKCWIRIISRCHNPRSSAYPQYGGRGIAVCDAWRGSFEAFFAYIGPRPSSRHSIDRIDGNRGYEPGNVRWATPQQQSRNTRSNRLVTIQGRVQCVTTWCEKLGLNIKCFYKRLKLGWTEVEALLTPSGAKRVTPDAPPTAPAP